jgi:hypothetical protein
MFVKRMGAGLALIVAGALFNGAQAAPVSGLQETKRAANEHALAQKTQVFVYDDDEYCFYWDGWNGPGWYYCGYEWRSGYGWGGAPGWHGWRYYSRDWHRKHRGWDRRHIRRGEPRRSEPRRIDRARRDFDGGRRSFDRNRGSSERVYRGSRSGRDSGFRSRSDSGRSMNRGGGGGNRSFSSGGGRSGGFSGGGGRSGGGGGGGRGGDGGGRGR